MKYRVQSMQVGRIMEVSMLLLRKGKMETRKKHAGIPEDKKSMRFLQKRRFMKKRHAIIKKRTYGMLCMFLWKKIHGSGILNYIGLCGIDMLL